MKKSTEDIVKIFVK